MQNEKNLSKLYLIITASYVTCLLLSNLIAGKLWSLNATVTLPAAVTLFPVTYILGDIFTEVYGFKKARTIIWLGFACNFFAVAIYFVTIILPHPDFWTNQGAYEIVLGMTPRITIASFVGYIFGEFSNSVVLSKLKVKTKGKALWLRTISSTIVGEGFDSLIFITISFWGTVPNAVLSQMILFQFLFKVAYEIIFTPVTYIAVRFVKKSEGIDTFDYSEKYKIF